MKTEIFGKYGSDVLDDLPIRELNFARARLGVLDAFVQEIALKNTEEIRIKDLCRKAQISEPSFYNYFPRKDDLFLYFISLWSIDAGLHLRSFAPGLERIHELFVYTAGQCAANYRLMGEVIAYQARTNPEERVGQITPVSPAEKRAVFGQVEGLNELPAQGLFPVLQENIQAAIQLKELPPDTPAADLLMALAALFFGIPVIALHTQPDEMGRYYESALHLILPLKTQSQKRPAKGQKRPVQKPRKKQAKAQSKNRKVSKKKHQGV